MPTTTNLTQAVTKSVESLATDDHGYSGLVQLALAYAAAIDEAGTQNVLRELGPKLLSALSELGLTPKARADVLGKTPGQVEPANPLTAFRDRAQG